MTSLTPLEAFEKMVSEYDLLYVYSDDHRAYSAGAAQEEAIREAAKALPEGDVVRIWNAAVDRKLSPAMAACFKMSLSSC